MLIEFETRDGVLLKGYWFEAKAPKGAVLVNPGTATQTLFYKRFCEFLVAHGYHVMLWNYRGFCESKAGSLKGQNYLFSDIGRYDIPAAIDEIQSRTPGHLPIFCVGHSAGGQQFGFAHNAHVIKGLVTAGTSAGYFPDMPLSYRIKAYFFFRCFAPVSQWLTGYVAAKRFGFMEDITGALAKEWNGWCSERHLFFADKYYGKTVSEGHYKALPMPVHVISACDDEISTPNNINNFWQHVRSQFGITFKQYSASASPEKKIGHFGYFRRTNTHIWQDILQQIERWNA